MSMMAKIGRLPSPAFWRGFGRRGHHRRSEACRPPASSFSTGTHRSIISWLGELRLHRARPIERIAAGAITAEHGCHDPAAFGAHAHHDGPSTVPKAIAQSLRWLPIDDTREHLPGR